jgi:flagellar protein FliO/FliZ
MDAVGAGPGWGTLLWFLFVLAAIPLVLWVLKRSSFGALGSAAPGAARLVGVLPLSAAQRVITVEVGQGEERRWLVLGVTAQHIATLHTMAPGAEAPSAGPAAPAGAGFATVLARLRQPQGTGDAR